MFRKILIIAMFATAAGYCFAAESLPQVVTSEVFYEQDRIVDEGAYQQVDVMQMNVPAWPLAGSDADVEVACEGALCSKTKQEDNIRIVSKIGADLVVENNFNLGARGEFTGWSGGANMLHGAQIPVGFDDECDGSEMSLLHREVLEDDGGNVLAVSRSGRKNCGKYADGYEAFAVRNGMKVESVESGTEIVEEETEIAVDVSADAEAPINLTDQVRSWVVANGQTLREVLQSWCDKEGWDLVWTTAREYPIEASAVFKGRFVDVASALVRNFGRATPIPYAKFYKGNRVLVISTDGE
ncbi:MAG: toxin co-regulated pilus biosynthesis Q family protein [Alphaproteobacteria bacterium]|nr:toxin co-regulated pilus biosynthesis Q family protein [Alphaproteobacteria bacterium]